MTSVPGEEPTQSGYPNRWEERWSTGRTGWDQGDAHPCLVELLSTGRGDELGIVKTGRAFVPGCGRGYDLPVFAARGLDVYGMDISETGVAAANKYLESISSEERFLKDKVRVKLGDFFAFDPSEKFDVIYDYTFLCALPPDLRKSWATQMTLLSKPSPSTQLITLMWPINGNPGGPPYSLTPEIYDELLGNDWEIVWQQDVPEEKKRKESPPGDEKIAVWKRRI